jgi:hypothetical protein
MSKKKQQPRLNMINQNGYDPSRSDEEKASTELNLSQSKDSHRSVNEDDSFNLLLWQLSADLYAELYTEDAELPELTEMALAGWPT